MDFVTDLHLHSKYSQAVSKNMTLPVMVEYGRKKGFEILATGDWTHPLWLQELKSQLVETKEGLFEIKSGKERFQTVPYKPIYFLLAVEISSIYSQGGRGHRIHNIVLSPSFETSEKINDALRKRGCNLSSDGRPIIGLSARDLVELVLSIDQRVMIIPAHIWTPWFSLYGANSGFDSLTECFGDMSQYIYGIETGLSSDPEMNWQISELKTRSILSFSDAHSPAKMGREATVFRLESPSYENIRKAIMSQSLKASLHSNILRPEREVPVNRVSYTIEFYPEEGKYHYNGHRNCKVIETPNETRAKGVICPVCNRKLTVGVMQRVEDLIHTVGDDLQSFPTIKTNKQGVRWITDPTGNHPPFVKIVPLNEIIAESFGMRVAAQKVKNMFDVLCESFGTELEVLLKASIEDIAKISTPRIADGVQKVRAGDIVIRPGFDGEYGIVKIWSEDERKSILQYTPTTEKNQLGIDF